MENNTPITDIFETIQQNGLQAMTILINQVMKIEPEKHLQCEPFECSECRRLCQWL